MMKHQGQKLAWVCEKAGPPAGYRLGLPIDSAPETAAQEALAEQQGSFARNIQLGIFTNGHTLCI